MKEIIILISTSLFILFFFLFFSKKDSSQQPKVPNLPQKETTSENQKNKTFDKENNTETISLAPLKKPKERITKKSFGDFITPENSPIQPERFSGYHTGVDFEVFPEELDSEVEVRAICSGKIRLKSDINGYGGVLIQDCVLESEPATVIYGHLDLNSIEKQVGGNLNQQEIFANLGDHQSSETDEERKHLHLGIHRGPEINFLGYVNNQSALENWINPCPKFCE
jgi:hypothetical protein